ncbi:MAG: PAS domain S-box protein [Flavobacteriaceae bacterium]
MISLSKYKFRTRLIAGFAILIVFNIISITISLLKIRENQNNLTLMYEHPLVVSNAVREINTHVNVIHTLMQDIVYKKKDNNFVESKIVLITKYDNIVKNNFKLLLERFLGNKDVILKQKKLYLKWEPIRQKELLLIRSDNRSKELNELIKQAEKLIFEIKKQSDKVSDFAKKKADQVYNDNLVSEKEAVRLLYILMFSLVVLSTLIGIVISNSISKPIKDLISKIEKDVNINVKKGTHKTEQELLELMVKELEKAHEKVKNFNEKLKVKIEEKTQTLNASKKTLEKSEKELFEKNQFFEKTVAGTPLAFIYFDTNSIIQRWNTAAEIIFGYTVKEAIGKDIVDLIVPKEIVAEINEVIDDVFNETGGTIKQNINITKSGRRILCRWHNAEIKDENNKVIGLTSIVEDVTERTKVAQDLENTNQSLQDLVYIASHDLQVPLVSMEGYTAELLADNKDKLDEEGVFCLKRLQSNARRMHKLVLSLLDISRLNTHINPYEEFKVKQVLESALNDLSLVIKESKVKITLGRFKKITADKQRVEGVFRNLIINAINYGATQIDIGYKDATFFVKDNGIGIPKEQLERIFKPGERLKQNKAEGIGMGLSFCKKVIELHNGRIWAESEGKNKGAIFKIKFNT